MTDDSVRPEAISVQRAAQLLSVHEDTVVRLIRCGKLTAFKVGRVWRIHREDLIAFHRARRVTPPNAA
jgi:excisionase family DNA binding protein